MPAAIRRSFPRPELLRQDEQAGAGCAGRCCGRLCEECDGSSCGRPGGRPGDPRGKFGDGES